jgi:hypothetical protein
MPRKSNHPRRGQVQVRGKLAANPEKLSAIADFPRPVNITQLRSFLGFVGQLADFPDEISAAAGPLRPLLRQGNQFVWSADQEKAFETVKRALISPPVLANFDPSAETVLQTDASRKSGLGYVLLQRQNDHWKLIQCGSIFVSDTESRYAIVFDFVKGDLCSRELIRSCMRCFADFGVPVRVRSDGGTNLISAEILNFFKNWGVISVNSTPHYPQSNGHAEAAVKAMENLVQKAAPNGHLDTDAFQQGILEWRNTPREAGLSPAEIVFGHPIRSILPAHHTAFAGKWRELMDSSDRLQAERVKAAYDQHARPLRPLRVGDSVRVQDADSKRWDKQGIIVSVGESRDYRVKMQSGRIYLRNRKFLRLVYPPLAIDADPAAPSLAIAANPEARSTASAGSFAEPAPPPG